MKRLIAATVALTMLGSTAAMAHSRHDRHHHNWRGYERHHHDDGAGAAIAVGFGIVALAAILASQDDDRDRAYDRGGYYRGNDGYYYRNGYYDDRYDDE